MDAKNKARPFRKLIPSKLSTEPSYLQSMRQGQPSVNWEPDRALERWPVISIVGYQTGPHVFTNHLPIGARVVILPVVVAAHEDQPDVVFGRGGPVRMDFISAADQGGIKATVSYEESPKGSRSERSRYVYGALTMDISRHEVLVNGREVGLTRKEFDLLECLLKHPGHVRSRDVLMNAVWGYDYYGTTRTVDVHVRRLRRKIPLLESAIVCVRSLGYKLRENLDSAF